MATSPPKDALLEQLTKLETALDTPPVPGEMRNWALLVQQAHDGAARELEKRIEADHSAQLKEIAAVDPGLLSRVEEMRAEDSRNRDSAKSLALAIAEFEAKAAAAGPDEKKVEADYRKLMSNGVEFVVKVRQQETVIRTWVQEAFDRDRGEMD